MFLDLRAEMKTSVASQKRSAVMAVNRKSRQASGENQKQKRKRISSPVKDPSMREVHVGSKTATRWRNPATTTTNFVTDIIDRNIELTLGAVDPDCYEEVDEVLVTLKDKLRRRISSLSVPPPKGANYHYLNKAGKLINAELDKNLEQIDRINSEVEELEKYSRKLTKKQTELKEKLNEDTEENTASEQADEDSQPEELISTLQAIISSMETDHHDNDDDDDARTGEGEVNASPEIHQD